MPREARTLDQANYAEMLIEKRDDGVALITLNRPERHNASTAVMHAEFAQLPGDIQADADVMAAVITGAGRSFCSGADVQQRLGGGGEGMSALDVLGEPREIVEGFHLGARQIFAPERVAGSIGIPMAWESAEILGSASCCHLRTA